MDEVWKRNEPDSPCVNVCVMHPQAGICMGCYRTIDEISHWSTLDHPARLELMKTLPERAGLIKGKRRKR